jgi:hypothetical protein
MKTIFYLLLLTITAAFVQKTKKDEVQASPMIAKPTMQAEPAPVVAYYFSPSGNNSRTAAEAQNPQTPWQSTAVLQNMTIHAGTRLRFMTGEYGPAMLSYNEIPMTIAMNSERGWQGTSSDPIVIENYNGSTPVFTSYKTAVNPVAVRGRPNIYAYPVQVFEELSVVEIDGHVKAPARYPKRTESGNRGYLVGRTKSGGGLSQTAIITADFIPSQNIVGADVVTRASEYTRFSHKITGQTATSVSFINMAFAPIDDNFGTYFQNHLSFMTAPGDWAFVSGKTDTLYVYFADNNPAKHVVRYATSNYNTWVLGAKNVTFKNINFSGANVNGAQIQNAANIAFDGVNFTGMGRHAIWQVNGAANSSVRNSTTKHCFAGAFDFGAEPNTVIENNRLDSISIFAVRPTWNASINNGVAVQNFPEGFHGSGAIIASGNNGRITNNIIRYAGNNGIIWGGASTVVEGNYIDYATLRTTDAGGIYTFNANGPDYSGAQMRHVTNNTVLNILGDPGGTPNTNYSPVFGIYNDDEVNRVTITGNVIAYVSRAGIYNHHTQHIKASQNIILDAEYGYYTRYGDNDSKKQPLGNTFTGDVIVSTRPGQVMHSLTVVNNNPGFAALKPAATATFSGINYYAYDAGREVLLLVNPTGKPTAKTYSSGPWLNIKDGKTLGTSPVVVPPFSALIGYKTVPAKPK